MRNIAKKILLSVSVGAMGLSSSLWASSQQEESSEIRGSAPSLQQRKNARHFLPQEISPFKSNMIKIGEKLEVDPSEYGLELLHSIDEGSRLPDEESSDKSSSASLMLKTKSPTAGRRRTDSTSKKNATFKQVEKEIFEHLLPSSKASVHFDPQEGTLIEDDQQEIVMEVKFPSSYVQAPPSLTHDEVKRLLDIPLVYKTLNLGYSSTLSGDVAIKKEEIQDGLASHKLPAIGVKRIADILAEYPEAIAKLFEDEKRRIHTLSTQGYSGVIGHYKLILPLENGEYETLDHSSFAIAFAKKQ